MANQNKAIGYLELNSKQWDDAIASAKKALAGLAVAVVSFKTVDIFKEGTESAIKFGNEVYFAAQKLNGYDPGKLLIAQKALQAAGQSAEEARGNIQEFALAGRPLEQLFKGGNAGLGDALLRASKEYGTQAAILSQSAEKFAFVQNQLNNVGTKLQGFFLGLADKIANPLSALLDQIDRIDLVGMGEQFGAYISDSVSLIVGLVKNGDVFEALGLSLKIGFQEAINYFTGALQESVADAFDLITKLQFWEGIGKVAVGGLAQIGNFLIKMMVNMAKFFVAAIEAGLAGLNTRMAKLPGVGRFFNKNGIGFSDDISENFKRNEQNSNIINLQKAQDLIGASSKIVTDSGLSDIKNSMKDFGKNFKPGTIFDSSADKKSLSHTIEKAFSSGAFNMSGKNPNPVFQERADPVHVIADSLAKVGGGGRYVRTGLSITEKAAMDANRYLQQIQQNTQAQIKALMKIAGTPAMGGG